MTMRMKTKEYWCPRCGKIFKGSTAWMKHFYSKKCRNDYGNETNDEVKQSCCYV